MGRVFDSIRGLLLVRDVARCVIEAGGLGYAVAVPLSTFERLPAPGTETTLRLHLVVREDDWRLYGFATEDERALFRACLSVSGVGPMTALALLSSLGPRDLRAAVAAGDVRALTRVKGVGKKTAERLLVDLRDAVGAGAAAGPASGPSIASGPLADAAAALVSLGLEPAEAADRLRRVRGAEGMPLPELVRKALQAG